MPRRGNTDNVRPTEIRMTDLEAEHPVAAISDSHAAGTPGGGTASGGLAGSNAGDGSPDNVDLENAMGSGVFDDAREEEGEVEERAHDEEAEGPPYEQWRDRRSAGGSAADSAPRRSAPGTSGSAQPGGARGLSKSQLQQYRLQLRALGQRMKADVSGLADETMRTAGGEASGSLSNAPLHLADLGTDQFNLETNMTLLENESQMMEEVADALTRIDQGNFGCCEACGQAIPAERLHFLPYARFCIACARKVEEEAVYP
jgi:DnaK suppressor protein